MNAGRDHPDSELQRLIRGCPEPERLSDERRQAIWRVMAARLEQTSAPRQETTATSADPGRAARGPTQWLRGWQIWGGLGVAAAAGFLLLAFSLRSRPELQFESDPRPVTAGNVSDAIARVEIARGECLGVIGGSRRALPADASLRAGDTVEAGAGSWVKLTTTDGSKMWLCPGTAVVMLGPRDSQQPVLKLVRGEIRADVAHDETRRFGVQTPAGDLQVLGTEFHCRVFPAIDYPQEDSSAQGSRSKQTRTLPPGMLLTVLSGAVSVRTAQGAEVVHGGQRVMAVGDNCSTQNVEQQMEYIRHWLTQPITESLTEVLSLAGVREYLITGMWAANPQTASVRHITDFLSPNARVIRRLGPNLALVNPSSVLLTLSGTEPIGGAGRPLVSSAPVLVNLRTGAKLELSALEGYSVWYAELSPDGRKLAFTGYRTADPNDASDGPQGGLYVLDMETLETLKISQLVRGNLTTTPHWSPDSRWVAVSIAEGYSNVQSLALVDTLSARVVETGINAADAYFTPDGRQIVCCSGFKAGGFFMSGVPVWGNLFIFTVPDGKPRELTKLPRGGAIQPNFSPDGAYLTYWEYPHDQSAMRTLHIVDMKTEHDTPVTKAERPELEWLSPTSLSLAPMVVDGKPRELKMLELQGEEWIPRLMLLKEARPTPEQAKSATALADQLFAAFRAYRNGADACDLHQIDKAQTKFKKARDTLRQVQKTLPDGVEPGTGSPGGLGLTKNDLAPYIREFSRDADMTPDQRIHDIVRNNLKYRIRSFLEMYVREEKKLPQSMEALAQHAFAGRGTTGTIRAPQLVFLVPGENPDKTTTSYTIVCRDDAAGILIIESTALRDGTKLRATYTKEVSADGTRVSFKQPVITEEAR